MISPRHGGRAGDPVKAEGTMRPQQSRWGTVDADGPTSRTLIREEVAAEMMARDSQS